MPADFAERIIAWQRRYGRNALPWQHPATAYRVWISEVMLQQTRVETVHDYFQRFIQRFPDVASLAAAHEDEVLALWSGLGYYARARNLHAAAKTIADEHGGELPADFDALVALPGIGRSTAGAIQSLGQGIRRPILDGNVKRVLARHAGIEGWPGRSAVDKQLWQEAQRRTPERNFARYNQGLMDLGATTCLRVPRCEQCPVNSDCVARRDGATGRIPAARPGRDRPLRETRVLVLQHRDDDRVWLERRPASGIWGGLWSLPEFPDEQALADWLRERGIDTTPEALEPVEHGFTHFRLTIHPHRIRTGGQQISENTPEHGWHHRDQLPGGIPAPIARLLSSLPGHTDP